MSNNSRLMSYSRTPSRPDELSGRITLASDPYLVRVHGHQILLCPLRQPKKECSQAFPHVLQLNVSRVLRVSLLTLDLIHCVFHRPQTKDRAQISMGVHIRHLGSKVSRIFGTRNFAQRELLALQEIFHKQESKLDVLHASRTHSRMLRARGRTVGM